MKFFIFIQYFPRPLFILGILSILLGIYLNRPAGPENQEPTIELTTFTRNHFKLYQPRIEEWNQRADKPEVDMQMVVHPALKQLVMNSFFSGRGFTDIVEVEAQIASQSFAGPVEDILLRDIKPLLEKEGLLEKINPPSVSPWTRKGRIYGIPEDVHPVLLAYRADLIEEAGLSLEGVETWKQFEERLRPLIEDLDGDGIVDRYLINFWPTQRVDYTGLFIRQRNPELVTEDGRIHLDTPVMADTIVDLVLWCVGPDRIAAEAPHFSAAGYRLMLDGYVVAMPIPDWYTELYINYLPTLSGKIKLMPLPAWEQGGPRTSVWGGTMTSFYRDSEHFEDSWEFAKQLHFSREGALERFRQIGIITPITEYWDDPLFAKPHPYFSGQPIGEMFIEQAPHVPVRYSSPFLEEALQKIQKILISTQNHAESKREYSRDALLPEVTRQLGVAQRQIDRLADRNPYFP